MGADRGSSRLGHSSERSLLVTGVAADRADKIRHQVMTPPQQHIDVAPGAVDSVAALHEPVVRNDAEHADCEHNPDDHEDRRRQVPSMPPSGPAQ